MKAKALAMNAQPLNLINSGFDMSISFAGVHQTHQTQVGKISYCLP
jgi:hypothetical protein